MESSVDVYGLSNMNNRTSGNFAKRRPEDGDGRSSTPEECDSTTEPANHKMQFKVDEDVYYQEETGQNVLGTVAFVQGKKIKIIFMDETEKWTHISKVKKLSCSYNDELEDTKHNSSYVPTSALQPVEAGSVSSFSKKKSKGDLNGQSAPKENLQVTCGSCGTQKMITSKKALEYSPYTIHQYNCRKCINKSKTSKNNGVPLPLTAHYLAAARGRPKGSDNGAMPLAKGILEQGITNGMFRQENDICLHCRTQINEKVSLHCTMCERPCHPSCLALTPPPLPGDIFWSIICHVCGTQKPDGAPENDSQKLYSSRRSISSWSDVAYLLLSCLGCKYSNERFFDLDEQIIPFWEENLSRLHLPRQYKTAEPNERRKLLLLALNNANLRFINDDEMKTNPLWAIKDHKYKGLNMVIKPPVITGGRAVTAAGFPISVRTSNPEAASVAMTNIAQTIAANKANTVPTPKNSPSHVPTKSAPVVKASGAGTVGFVASTGRKISKLPEHPPVAKKSASGLCGVKWAEKDSWSSRRFTKAKFLPKLPKAVPNNNFGNRSIDDPPANSQTFTNPSEAKILSVGPQPPHPNKHNVVLSASPGGAARVTGVVLSSTSSTSGTTVEVNSKANCGSYPVRKNGSPMLNRSIRVEPVDRKKVGDTHLHNGKPFPFEVEGVRKGEQELIRESPGFNNTPNQKLPVKRKLALSKPTEGSSSTTVPRVLDGQTEAKKLKMSLPTSTDVTSQRIPSPSKPPDSDYATKGPKKAMSPLQKLSDLQRNGGLTVACLTHTESGVQTVAINPSSLDDGNLQINGNDSNSADELKVLHEKYETPIKTSNGATVAKAVETENSIISAPEADDNTKDKTNNVTTSPRAFKLASVSSPGTSKPSPVAERRIARPVRLKRSVAVNVQAEKQSKDPVDTIGKSTMAKKVTGKGTIAAAALVAKASRGRPKKPFKLQLRKPSGMTYNIGQFNGPVQNETIENATGPTINESEYSWNNSTISDLLEYGQGYRLECLPRCPDNKEEIVQAAIKHFKDELTPRPPSYWSTSCNHSKKPSNQKSRKDLKNVDSYYISGRSIAENGIQYQVVWRDGYGFEYSSDDEEELGVGLGEENYLCFEDYDHMEYFLDKMPVTVNSLVGHCDSDKTASEQSDSGEGECLPSTGIIDNDILEVKREPIDSAENTPVKQREEKVANALQSEETRERNSEPMIIDLTDSP